ncbi:MAG TPA: enoyl-CoA hydratase/isomerase family protein [Chloroflexota bacterium]
MIASESREGVTIVRLDRPERSNALVPALLETLIDHLRRAAASGRPVILTGRGRAFCAGADLKWLATFADPSLGVAELVAAHHLAITTIIDMPVPVIAALNGSVAGGGMGLVLAADYCLAAESASFVAAYFRLGLTPDGGATTFLERTIGLVRARELLLTNRRLSAREAYEWGLVNALVGDDELLDRAVAFATSLEPVPGYALLQTRRLFNAGNLRNQLQMESVAIRTAAKGEFFRKQVLAFRQRHPDRGVTGPAASS